MMGLLGMSMPTSRFFAVSFACALAVSCSWLDQGRQVRTVANMQTISSGLESLRALQPDLLSDRGKVLGVIRSVASGRDAWGNEYLYYYKMSTAGPSYVLISMGKDGRAEYKSPELYFSLSGTEIHVSLGETSCFATATRLRLRVSSPTYVLNTGVDEEFCGVGIQSCPL